MSKIDREPTMSYVYRVNHRSKEIHRWVSDGERVYTQEACNADDAKALAEIDAQAAAELSLLGYSKCGHDWE